MNNRTRNRLWTAAVLTAIVATAGAWDASALLPIVTDGAWTPAKLGDKLACWFDASDATTVLDAGGAPADDGEAVQTWQDKSGNGRHATAPAEAQRPTRQVGVQNGLAVIRTDGDAQLNIGSVGSLFRAKSTGKVFAVVYDSGISAGDLYHVSIALWRNVANSIRAAVYSKSGSDQWVANGRRLDSDSIVSAAAGNASAYTLIHAFYDWGNGFARSAINGGTFTSSAYSSGSGLTSDTDSAGAVIFWNNASYRMPAGSEIAEVIVVNAAMTDAEVAATIGYLRDKWGTP